VRIKDPIKNAFKRTRKYLRKKISVIASSKRRGGNTAATLSITAELNMPVVDNDLLDRAVFEPHQCTDNICKIFHSHVSLCYN